MSGATRGQPPPPWHMNSHTRGPHKLLTDACWGQGEAAAATRTRMRGAGGRAANSGVNAWTCSPRSSRTEKQRGKTAMIRNVNICTEPRRDSVPFARGPSKKEAGQSSNSHVGSSDARRKYGGVHMFTRASSNDRQQSFCLQRAQFRNQLMRLQSAGGGGCQTLGVSLVNASPLRQLLKKPWTQTQ